MPPRSRPIAPRIGTGDLAGRKLLGPPGRGTRPITGLAKKSLFGILTPHLADAVVLDLYSGTGTLGLEALSNGARRAAFAESSRAVVSRLERNLADCGVADRCDVWAGNVETRLADWLADLGEAVDVAFVDPPYPAARRWSWDRIADRIFSPLGDRLAPGGLVVLRLPGDVEAPEHLGPLRRIRTKHYGQGMAVAFYKIAPGANG